jgi:hypothetical protein
VNLGAARIVLRHRTALEVLDLSLSFVRRVAPRTTLSLVAVVLVPLWLGLLALRHGLELSWWWVWPVAVALAALVELPFLVAAGAALFEPAPATREVLRQSAAHLPSWLAARGLVLGLLVASALLVFGPLFVASSYGLVPEVVVLERARGLSALRRARALLTGRSGSGSEALLLRLGMTCAFVLYGELLGQALLGYVLDVHAPVETLLEDGGSAFALLGLLAAVPYTTAYRFLAYTNERTRRDGWDVQVAFLRLASEAPGRVQEGKA